MANIFRHLIYEEKPLNAFSIEEEGTMDFALFEVLMTMGQFKDEKSIIRLYNDAYFVCTLLVDYYQLPYIHIDDCKALIKNAYKSELNISDMNIAVAERYSYIVLIVSYCLLKHIDNWENDVKLKRTITRLGGKIQEKPNLTNILFPKITSATSNNKTIYSANVYRRRKITKDILTGIDWNKQTKEYNIEKIEEVVGYAATNEEKILLLSSIEAEFGKIYDDLTTVSTKNQVQYATVLGCLKKLKKEVSENIQEKKDVSPLLNFYWQGSFNKTPDTSQEHSDYEKELHEAKKMIEFLKHRLNESSIQIQDLELKITEKEKEALEAFEDEVLEDGMPLVFEVEGKEYKLKATNKNIRYLLCLIAKKALGKEKLEKEEYELLQYILKMNGYKSIETNYNKITKNLETGFGNGGLLPKEKDVFDALREKYDL